ncbi:hypothetical protein GLYMA_03G031166v4 [Glycine max]|nr:hypothetical protein GLYMA_03G031166v4 [Glycine max]KAH1068437.1 hypothetical protein GYH30_006122 [Glycine max]
MGSTLGIRAMRVLLRLLILEGSLIKVFSSLHIDSPLFAIEIDRTHELQAIFTWGFKCYRVH